VPVVAIVGQTERSAMGGAYQQEVDLQALFKDVASDYLVEVNVPEQLPNAIDRAFRAALARRAPTALIIPSDLQAEDYSPPEHAFKQVPSSAPGLVAPTVVPDEGELLRAAEVLNAGQRVAILVGQGTRAAAAEVEQVADVLGAGVAKALLGKDVLADDLPFVTGSIGLLGTRPSYELMRDCDTLLIVGSNFPYSQFLPEFGQTRAVQIDIDGALIGMRYPTEVNLLGDARTALQACCRCSPDRPTAHSGSASRRTWPAGGGWWSGRRCSTRSRSTRCGSCGSSRSASRTTRWCRPTPAPSPTGTPSTCGCAVRCVARCRAHSPRWARPCRTRSGRSSPTPAARRSHSSATAPCR
jgi:thiamine pyrophosphate-dependent acetolactate synthase large subunit-like protein